MSQRKYTKIVQKPKRFGPDPSHVIAILVRIWNNLSALRNTQQCCPYVHLSFWMGGCGWNWVWKSPIHIFQLSKFKHWLTVSKYSEPGSLKGGERWAYAWHPVRKNSLLQPHITHISSKPVSITSYSPVTCTNATRALLLSNRAILF